MTTFEARPPRWGVIAVGLFALIQLLYLGLLLRAGSTAGAAIAGVTLLFAAVWAFAMTRWRAVVTGDEVRMDGPFLGRAVQWTDVERVQVGGGVLRTLGGARFIPRTGKKVIVPGGWRTGERDATIPDLAAQAARDAGVDVEQRSAGGAARILLLLALVVAGVVVGMAIASRALS